MPSINSRFAAANIMVVASCLCLNAAADEKRIARGREILKLLTDEKYDEFSATGDEKMRSAFGPDKARQAWAGIQFQVGTFGEVAKAAYQVTGGLHDIVLDGTFEKGTATLRVVLNAQDRMTGFWVTSLTPNTPYAPPDYVNEKAFREQPATISEGGPFPLPGTLTLPTGDGPFAAVVLVHGSGSHDQDETLIANKPFRDLAWGLASRGVAVLRYEKRTHKYPTGTTAAECTLYWETIDDAVAAAALLRGNKAIDPRRVFVAGHSLGAMAAPFVAQKDPKLAGIILLAGNSRSILDLLTEQTAYVVGVDGTVDADEQKALDQVNELARKIRAGQPVGDDAAVGLPGAYLEKLSQLDQVAAARQIRTPMLIIQGARDYQVTTADFELWKKELKDKTNVTYRLYDDLNHLFMPGKGKATPAEYQKAGHVDGRVVTDVAAWIEAQAGH